MFFKKYKIYKYYLTKPIFFYKFILKVVKYLLFNVKNTKNVKNSSVTRISTVFLIGSGSV